jgi:hypothetical protein
LLLEPNQKYDPEAKYIHKTQLDEHHKSKKKGKKSKKDKKKDHKKDKKEGGESDSECSED